jgi:hypothetical protein
MTRVSGGWRYGRLLGGDEKVCPRMSTPSDLQVKICKAGWREVWKRRKIALKTAEIDTGYGCGLKAVASLRGRFRPESWSSAMAHFDLF